MDINRAREYIKENSKTSAKESLSLYEMKQHKPWFDEDFFPPLLAIRKHHTIASYKLMRWQFRR